jgi:NitT/TauT family transport system ATP-binding protein
MAFIEVKNISKIYHDKNNVPIQALQNINLNIEKGEFVCFLGASGCGKSSLLNIIAGFTPPCEGIVTIDGNKITKPSSKYVTIFQNYGLLPWRTVKTNIELGLEESGLKYKEIEKISNHYIELIGLSAFKNHHPNQLSGGMQQKVAIARALAVNPEILFMDEPFGALDAITRMGLQDETIRLCEATQKTIILVTHDIDEAIYLADRIIVMGTNPGTILKDIRIKESKPRKRNNQSFFVIKSHILEILHFSTELKQPEYFV